MVLKRTAILLGVCLLLIGITVKPDSIVWGQEIVAHRGASADVHENTLAAFREAWNQQADAIEGDFHLTKDGKIVCHHDADIRFGGQQKLIADLTFEELRSIQLKSKRSDRTHQIPSLEEVLELVPSDKKVLIEVKCGPEIVPELQRILESREANPDSIRVISFDAEVIAASKKAMPEIKAYWLTGLKIERGQVEPAIESILNTLERAGADGLDCKANMQVLTEEFLEAIRRRDYEVHVWTVNDLEAAAELRRLNVDSITTDIPQKLRESFAN